MSRAIPYNKKKLSKTISLSLPKSYKTSPTTMVYKGGGREQKTGN
jgi:hypothetical protein